MSLFNINPIAALTPLYLKTTASSGGVRVNWIWTESAIKYICDVYRSLTNDFTKATKVGDTFANDFWVDLTAQSGTTYYYWVQGRRIDGTLSPLVGPSNVTTGTIALADGGVTPQKLSTTVPVLSGGGSLTAYNLDYANGGFANASWSQARAFIGGTGDSSVSLSAIQPGGFLEATNWSQWYTVAYQGNTGFSAGVKVNVDLGIHLQFGGITAPAAENEIDVYARFIYVLAGGDQSTAIFTYEWPLYRSVNGVIRHAQPILNWKFNSTGAGNTSGSSAIIYEANKKYDFAIQIMKTRTSTNQSLSLYNRGCYLDISFVPVTP